MNMEDIMKKSEDYYEIMKYLYNISTKIHIKVLPFSPHQEYVFNGLFGAKFDDKLDYVNFEKYPYFQYYKKFYKYYEKYLTILNYIMTDDFELDLNNSSISIKTIKIDNITPNIVRLLSVKLHKLKKHELFDLINLTDKLLSVLSVYKKSEFKSKNFSFDIPDIHNNFSKLSCINIFLLSELDTKFLLKLIINIIIHNLYILFKECYYKKFSCLR